MKFKKGDIVKVFNGSFERYGIVIDDNGINKALVKVLVVYDENFHGGNYSEGLDWCKYEGLELVTSVLRKRY